MRTAPRCRPVAGVARGLSVAVALAVVMLGGWPSVAAAAEASVRRFALIVGSNNGGADRVELRYAVSDAQSVSSVLDQLGGVSATDRIILAEPSPDQLRAAFARLNEKIKASAGDHRRTEVFFYYSGHSDEYGLLLGSKVLGYPELRAGIKSLAADVRIAIVDACASGALLRRKGGSRVAPFLVDDSSDVSGHAFVTSSSATEVAQESDRLGASFFTHHLVTGLRGAADVSGDGRVTLNEAYRFAFDKTLARTAHTQSGPQHANYDIDLTGSGDIVITDIRQMSSILVIAPSLVGRFFIRDDAGHLIAEVDKVSGRAIELGLESGIYRVTFQRDGTVFAAVVELPSGGRTVLGQARFAPEGQALAFRERGEQAPPPAAPLPQPAAQPEATTTDDVGPRPQADPREVTALRLSLLPMLSFSGDGDHQLVDGVAFGLLGDQVDGVHGAQLSSIANIAGGWVEGAQLSGAVNYTAGDVTGAQVAGAVNVAEGWVEGAQIAGIYNHTDRYVDGVQIAGAVNHAGDVFGAQIGLINIADRVEGAQIGLVNIADSVDGVSLALLPIVDEGYNHIEVWGGDLTPLNIGFKAGAPWLYAQASFGTTSFDTEGDARCVMRLGGGLGTHVELNARFYMDIDLVISALARDCDIDFLGDDELLSQLKLSLGLELTPGLALFVGAAANVESRFDTDEPVRPLLADKDDDFEIDWEARFFPSFFVGLRVF